MNSGRVISADDVNYLHFFVLQHLSLIMDAANCNEAGTYTEQLVQLMSRYKELGGNLQ